MAPTIILIRHAQALHNYEIPDPVLSDLGFGPQCKELANFLQSEVPLSQKIELIVVSPLRRTLQTAEQALGWLIKRGVRTALRAEFQEISSAPCDTGTAISVMEKEWPQFDWSSVDPIFPAKTGLYAYTKDGLLNRGKEARRWLRARPEKVIAVVSHASFLRVGICNRRFENADFRIFDFAEEEDQDLGWQLKEWEFTEKRGGGLGKSPTGVFGIGTDDYLPEEVNL